MAKGHVKLGALGTTLREYIIMPERWRKAQANPWTTRISTGGDKYDDQEPFSFHVEQDWQAGVGNKAEDGGGFLFSTAETRVPAQVILPQLVKQSDARQINTTSADARTIGLGNMTGTYTVSSSGAIRRIATLLTAVNTGSLFGFYGYIPFGVSVTFETHATTVSGTLSETRTIVGNDPSPLYRWHTVRFNNVVISPGGIDVWMQIYPSSGSIEVAKSDVVWSGTHTQTYNGSAWAAQTYPMLYTSDIYPVVNGLLIDRKNQIIRFNGTLYSNWLNDLTKYTSGTDKWASVGTLADDATSFVVFNNILFVGQANGTNFRKVSTSDVVTDGGSGGVLFAKWNGILYKVDADELWYSSDGTTWSGPYVVCKSPEVITGIVGAQDTVWITTTDAVYYLAPGNVIRGVSRWGSIRTTNGTSPVNWQGTIYCIADGGIAQVNVAGGSVNVLPVWVNKDDDLVASYLERPTRLTVMNNWLVALVESTSTLSVLSSGTVENFKGSVWAYNGQGWHYLSEIPLFIANAIYYDFNTSKIWTADQSGVFFNVRTPDYTINPLNDTASRYAPSAWLETPWLNGGLVDVTKDFESVYIKGSELAAGQTVTVFWQERGGSWQELGTVDSDGEELRWSDPTTRPAVKEIKLGFRLYTNDMTLSPNIEAIRLKFRHNIEDRWAWTLIMPIHENQQMVDGNVNPYTRNQVKAHLESLVRSTPPFTFEDVDGEEYTVICAGYELNLNEYEYYGGANQNKYMAAVSLEQYIT